VSADSGDRPPARSSWQTGFREAAPYLSLGVQLAATMLVAIGGGYLLDQWLGTLPWFLVGGAMLGMASVIVQLVRLSQTLSRRARRPPGGSLPRSGPPAGDRPGRPSGETSEGTPGPG